MNDAYKAVFMTLNDLPKEFDVVKSALGDYSDEQNKAVEAVITFGEKAGSVLEQAVLTGSGDPRFLGGIFRSRLEEVLKNAGIPPEQIAEYIGLAGLGELQIEAAITVSLAEEERQKFYNILALFQAEIDGAPLELKVAINESIDSGEFDKAMVLIKAFTGQLSAVELGFIIAVDPRLAESLAPAMAAAQAALDAQNPVVAPVVLPPIGTMLAFLIGDAQNTANQNPIDVPVLLSPFGAGGLFAPGGLLNPGNGRNRLLPPNTGAGAPGGGGNSGFPPQRGFGGGSYSGGPAKAGMRYEVNEGGREFFTPSSDGFIMNASDAKTLVQGVSQIVSGGGGRGMTNNITINETSSPRQTALEVIRANKASLFLAGAL